MFEVTGFDETLMSMEKLASIPDGVMKEMLEAQADVIVVAQQRMAKTMLRGPYYKGGVAEGVSKGKYKKKKDGAEHFVVFKGTQHGNRLTEIAFVNEFGKKGQPARPFIAMANETSANESTDAAEKVFRNWQDSV